MGADRFQIFSDCPQPISDTPERGADTPEAMEDTPEKGTDRRRQSRTEFRTLRTKNPGAISGGSGGCGPLRRFAVRSPRGRRS
jgi:hypothetical protein